MLIIIDWFLHQIILYFCCSEIVYSLKACVMEKELNLSVFPPTV